MEMVDSLSRCLSVILYYIESVSAEFLLEKFRRSLRSFHRVGCPVRRNLEKIGKVLLGKISPFAILQKIQLLSFTLPLPPLQHIMCL